MKQKIENILQLTTFENKPLTKKMIQRVIEKHFVDENTESDTMMLPGSFDQFQNQHPVMLNKLLVQQVQKHLGDPADLPEAFTAFMESISRSYDRLDAKIKSLENSVGDCAIELGNLKAKLLHETAGLKNAHNEMGRIFNHVNEGFFEKDIIADRYIQMSVGCEKIYGYSIDDFYANSLLWFQVIHPADRYLIDKENELLNKGIQTKSIYRIIHKDKTTRWIEVKAIPVIIEGRLTRVEGVVNDITERKNAEKLLLDSEVKYRSFFENNMDGVLLSRPDGVIEEANPAACQMFAATEKEICGYSRSGLLNFADRAVLNLFEERSVKGRVKGEGNLTRGDGTQFLAEIASSIFKDANGEDRACIIVRDITDRKKAEAAMLINERQLDLIYNTVTDSIFMLSIEDADRYRFVSVNLSFLKSTGLKKEQLIGKYVDEVIPSPSLELVLEKYREAITGKRTISWEEQSAYPAGIKTGIVSISPVLDENGNCIRIIGSVHDISEHKKVEAEIKKSGQNFLSLVNTVDGIVWEADAETFQFSFVSNRAKVLLGYPVSAWIESPGFWKDHIHPEDRDRAVSYCTRCTREKISHEFEYRMITADGKIVWVQDFVSVIINEDQTCHLRGIIVDITGRKKSEQTIREGEEKYRSVVEQASDAIFINTLNGKLLDVNKSACDMLGYNKEELTTMNITDLLMEEGTGVNPGKYNDLQCSEIAVAEKNMVHSNGSLVPVEISSKILSDGRIIAIVRDISERRIAEKNIRESVERFQRLSQATHDAIWDWNLLTEEVWWNEGFFKLLGFDKKLPIPDLFEWTKKIHPDDRQNVISRLKKIRKNTVDFWEDEFRYEMTGGNYGTVLDRAYVLRDDKGSPIRVIGAIMDITERKKTEQQIAFSERRYRQIVETAQEGIWMIDENNNTTFINKKMCEIIEYSPEEIMGKRIHHFMDEVANKDAAEQIERRKRGISETHDSKFITKSGRTVCTSISTNPVFDESGIYKGALAMVTDITKRKRNEELLQKSEANLDLKNKELKRKNKQLEEFAYVVSHDLQEPLRTTTSFVQLLKQQYSDKLDEKANKYLHFIVDSSERMKILISDLLDYSRIGSMHEMERVDCNKILQDVTADLYKAISDSAAEIISEDLPIISGYPTEIKQLFQNLIVNAMKFSKWRVAPQIKISAERTGGYWNFAISDEGIGIEDAHIERIFVIFQRLHTRSEYAGSGIGLSHCKKIVELHNGKIWVKSVPGEGSVFHFTILENDGI